MPPWRDSAAELSRAAQKVTDTLRHVIRREPLDEELARHHARGLVVQPLTGVSAEQAYAALGEALASDVRLSAWRGDPRAEIPIDEEGFRAHLARVRASMDSTRPWVVPVLRPLDPGVEWAAYDRCRVVGRLHLRVPKVEDRVHTHLVPTGRPDGDGQVRVAVLRLRSGREVALVGHWWPDDPRSTAVLTRDPDTPADELMAELTSGDHFRPGEYDVVP